MMMIKKSDIDALSYSYEKQFGCCSRLKVSKYYTTGRCVMTNVLIKLRKNQIHPVLTI